MRSNKEKLRLHIWMLASLAFVYGLSFINPFDRLTWALETTPGLIGIIILIATYSRFRFSDSTYAMIWFGAVLLILGGFYAFGNVPFFSYLQDKFSLERNYYDRFGHIFQGIIAFAVAREYFKVKKIVNGSFWTVLVAFCLALAVSATYELFEWAVAVVFGEKADNFLAYQSDIWDAQADMLMASLGAIFMGVLTRNKG